MFSLSALQMAAKKKIRVKINYLQQEYSGDMKSGLVWILKGKTANGADFK